MGERRGRRPVACDFCRQRKLRCDRIVPCYNCASRGANCQFQEKSRSYQPPVNATGHAGQDHLASSLSTRLDRLETALTGHNTLWVDSREHVHKRRRQRPSLPQPNAQTLHNLMQDVSELDSSLSFQRLHVSFWHPTEKLCQSCIEAYNVILTAD